jgi:hypothetical protein
MHKEWLVADGGPRTQDGETQPEWLALPNVDTGYARRNDIFYGLQHVSLAAFGLCPFELGIRIKVFLDCPFCAARYKNQLGRSGSYRFFHRILNKWLVYNGQHFFRTCFGSWQETGATPRNGKYCRSDWL